MSEGTLDSRRERRFALDKIVSHSIHGNVCLLLGWHIYIYMCVCVFFARTLFGHVLNMCGSQNDERDILMHFECLNWCDVTVNRGDNVAYDMMG
jgi:hypothetical protein